MYRWRCMTADQREQVLAIRKQERLPWHSPPHYASDTSFYLITAACYEHRPVIGRSYERMSGFESALLTAFREHAQAIFAWTVLPNHYHVLAQTCRVRSLLSQLGQLHGRTSYQWNGEDGQRGRKVWCNAAETAMKSERHYWATLLYVVHNAVRHRYVERWQEWPYSNAAQWLEDIGHDRAERMWREYPIDEYGADWDPPDF
jgi:putative transposase